AAVRETMRLAEQSGYAAADGFYETTVEKVTGVRLRAALTAYHEQTQTQLKNQLNSEEQLLANAGRTVAICSIIITVLLLALGWVLARRLTAPLLTLAAAAERIGDGDYAVTVPVRGRNELGGLAAAFNRMVLQLQAADQQVRAANQQLAAANQQLRASDQQLRAELLTRQAAERRLAQIIEFLPDATLIVDPEGRVIAWNRAMERLTGVKAAVMLGTSDYALPFYGERRPILIDLALHAEVEREQRYTAIRREGDILYGEAYTPGLPGGDAHLVGTASVLRDEHGVVVAAIECIRNNTARHQAEQELLYKNLLLATQFEASIDGILVVDGRNRIVQQNRQFAELWNIPAPLLKAGDDAPVLQRVAAQVSEPDVFRTRVEYLYAHRTERSRDEIALRDGRVFDRYSAPLLGTDDQYYGRIWFFRDITERKRAELALLALNQRLRASEQQLRAANQQLAASEQQQRAANQQLAAAEQQQRAANQQLAAANQQLRATSEQLRESEQKFRTIIADATDGVVAIDVATGRLTMVNPHMLELTGYSETEVLKQDPSEWFPVADRSECLALFRACLHGERQKIERLPLLRRDGSEILTMVSVSHTQLGGRPHAVGFVRDITEQVRTHEHLVRAERLSATGTLASGVAHEFNNILAIIRAQAQLLAMMPACESDAEIRQQLAVISEQTKRGAEVASGIMALARPTPVTRRTVRLAELVERVLLVQRKPLELESIAVQTAVPAELTCEADPGKLQQVLLNLVINARHAMQPLGGGRLTISARPDGAVVRLIVADSGIGMDDTVRRQLFTPFFTTKGGRAQDGLGQKGSGLGLAVSFTIMREHGGKIEVASAPGKGASFTLVLPRRNGGSHDADREKEK
ncbi:MAG TPA: PAS domain S-box protein, partial [bacterium]|nr:PAS domain S-box protein [bacterium]